MVFTSEHKIFIIESYFRNGVFNNGEWIYRAALLPVDPSFDKNFQI
jgi:hypothetical protein